MVRQCSLIFVLLILLFASCKQDTPVYNQGIVYYEVTYPKLPPDHFMMSFLPKEMILKFKDGKYISELSTGMGVFKTTFIINNQEQTYYQTLKIINKKYYSKLDKKGVNKMLKKLPVYRIAPTQSDSVTHIATFPVKAYRVTCPTDTFLIYATDSIKVNKPYWATQYKSINGFLLQYRLENYGITMELKAKKIEWTEVDDTDFVVPADYKEISQDEMDKEMIEIFSNF